ncbi:hypothetical protein AAG747_25405 [Rapidithrix thailandica]|uniref:Photosystem I assembly protein Ycf4 n=1 Tax=Rapidithrix thailandica TaxID=413964 RepID=A0AAW9SFD8_9BACT
MMQEEKEIVFPSLTSKVVVIVAIFVTIVTIVLVLTDLIQYKRIAMGIMGLAGGLSYVYTEKKETELKINLKGDNIINIENSGNVFLRDEISSYNIYLFILKIYGVYVIRLNNTFIFIHRNKNEGRKEHLVRVGYLKKILENNFKKEIINSDYFALFLIRTPFVIGALMIPIFIIFVISLITDNTGWFDFLR